MKKVAALVIAGFAITALTIGVTAQINKDKGGRVMLIHKWPKGATIITVDKNAVEAHLSHGDTFYIDNVYNPK